MTQFVIDPKFRHLLMERGRPGLYLGFSGGQLLQALGLSSVLFTANPPATATILFISGSAAFGVVVGALATAWWEKWMSRSQLPEVEADLGRVWKWGLPLFALLGGAIAVILSFSTLLLATGRVLPKSMADALVLSVYTLSLFAGGLTVGTITYLLGAWVGKQELWKKARRGRLGTYAPLAVPSPLLKRGWTAGWPRKKIARSGLLTLLVLILVPAAAIVLFSPAAIEKPSAVKTTATIMPTAVILTATPPPTATATAPRVPAPPTGAPITQATVVSPSATPPVTATKPAPTRTATRTAPASLCTYTTVAGDTWALVGAKTQIAVGKLIEKNPGANPAQLGTVLKIPRAGCP